MKKLLSVFLALVMVFALCGGALADAEASTEDPAATSEPTTEAPAEETTPAEEEPEATTEPTGDLAGQIVILHTNDVHGAIDTYAKVAAMKAEYEARGAEVLLIDAGDYIQGEPAVSVSQGLPLPSRLMEPTPAMTSPPYRQPRVRLRLSPTFHDHASTSAQFTVVIAANASRTTASSRSSRPTPSSTLAERRHHRRLRPGHPRDRHQGPPRQARRRHLPRRRRASTRPAPRPRWPRSTAAGRATTSVCLGHLGIDDSARASPTAPPTCSSQRRPASTSSSTATATPPSPTSRPSPATTGKVGGTLLTSTGTKRRHRRRRHHNPAEGTASAAEQRGPRRRTTEVPSTPSPTTPPSSSTTEVDAPYGAVIGSRPRSTSAASSAPGNRTQETNNGDLIADAILWYAKEHGVTCPSPTSTSSLITNGGGIRAAIAAGDITKKDVNTVLPFGNTVAYVTVKGSVLLEALEASTYCTPEEPSAPSRRSPASSSPSTPPRPSTRASSTPAPPTTPPPPSTA